MDPYARWVLNELGDNDASDENDVRPQAVRDMGARLRTAPLAYPLGAAIFIFPSLHLISSWPWLWGVYVVLTASSLLRIVAGRRLAIANSPHRNIWFSRYLWLSTVSPFLWGALIGSLAYLREYDYLAYFAYLGTVGVTAGAIGTMTMSSRLWLAFVAALWLPVLVTTTAGAIFVVSDIWPLAIMVVAFAVFVGNVGRMVSLEYIVGQRAHRSLLKRTEQLADALFLLEEKEEEVRAHRDHLQEKVNEQTAGLMAATRQAEAANKAKSEFLANMSHELRTPLHAIVSFAQLGEKKGCSAPSERVVGYFRKISVSSATLLALVNDLLDLAKLEAGRLEVSRQGVDLARLVGTVLNEFEALAASNQLAFSLSGQEGKIFVLGDPERLKQVVRNLVSNAIKFSPSSRSIEIDIAVNGRTTITSVRDYGDGVPESEKETIFNKFIQSAKTDTGAGGTGLGLAICRDIVKLHEGRIWVEDAEGGGAQFCFALPAAEPARLDAA